MAKKIENVFVLCEHDEECRIIKSKILSLKGLELSRQELENRLKSILLSKDIKAYGHKMTEAMDLTVEVIFFKRIKKITFMVDDETRIDDIRSYLRIQEGGRSHPKLIGESKQILTKYLHNEGRSKVTVQHEERPLGDGVEIVFKIDVERIDYVKDITIISDKKELVEQYRETFHRLKGRPFRQLQVKVLLDDILKNLMKSGYYKAKVSLVKEYLPDEESRKRPIRPKIHIHAGLQYNFHFKGNRWPTRFELIESIRQDIQANRSSDLEGIIKEAIKRRYEGMGLYDSTIDIWSKTVGQDSRSTPRKIFFITIQEGRKRKLEKLIFEGRMRMSFREIKDIYDQNATPLASRGYFDRSYLTKFSKLLEQEYLKRGFLFATVSDVEIKRRPSTYEMSAYYEVKENVQCILRKINIEGISKELGNKIKKVLINQENRPLNVVEIENDLNKALQVVRQEGYFFAKFKTLSKESIVSYLARNSLAEINIHFSLGKKSLFQEAVVTGNVQTKTDVVEREVRLKKNEVITLEKVNLIKERIGSLGPFSTVKITPYITNEREDEKFYRVHLLIEVREKDFGIAEISPGYRTDIGVKISTLISHSNLWNKNHSFSTKGQINQRLDYNNLDQRRKSEAKDRIEGLVKTSYVWPYFFNVFKLDASLGFQRKRFYSFDADILRVSPRISKDITDFFSASFSYQFEKIRQFDATDEEKDKDTFQIGGLTPSLTIDFRDHPIRPRRGSFFRLSWEFANPNFSFAKESEQKNRIDFSKLIARSKFYYSRYNWSLAFSLAVGGQWNYAKELGDIPSIKVFRLDGYDSIRGFADDEVNRTLSGEHINESRKQDKVYFTSLKFEPRYYPQDHMAFSLFFDAGGLFIDHYKPLKLRTSVGLGLKFLTPVGTLDFDYGVKLKRRTFKGERERVGRFHLSIGYF